MADTQAARYIAGSGASLADRRFDVFWVHGLGLTPSTCGFCCMCK
ncbi:MAG TPA: hypothetical protein PLO14_03215 [Accumulibacter sp.]|nr:hypothetical protein [Accumulibacter sp.]HNC51238.1 hypothetical protein [Accumulibacter sp.]